MSLEWVAAAAFKLRVQLNRLQALRLPQRIDRIQHAELQLFGVATDFVDRRQGATIGAQSRGWVSGYMPPARQSKSMSKERIRVMRST